MVATIFGVLVGIFTGFNLRMISYLLTRAPRKTEKSNIQLSLTPEKNPDKTASFLSELRDQVVVRDPLPAKKMVSGTINMTREYQPIMVRGRNKDDSESNEGRYIFEDDDGYNYSSYENSTAPPYSGSSNEPMYVAGILQDDSIIPEENENESSEENDSVGQNEDYHADYSAEEDDDTSSKNDLFSLNRNDNTGTMHTEMTMPLKQDKYAKK